MKNFFILFLPGLFIAHSICLQAQETKQQENIFNHLTNFYSRSPGEKLYVQTDKSYYQAGDNIWFSIYLVNAGTHKISYNSKKIYLQLLNDRDSVIEQIILNSQSYRLYGSLAISDSLASGSYLLRVYTTNMLMDKDSRIFSRYFYIANSLEKIVAFPVFNHDTLQVTLTDYNHIPYTSVPVQYSFIHNAETSPLSAVTTDSKGIIKIPLSGIAVNNILSTAIKVQYKNFTRYFRCPGTAVKIDVQFLPEGGNIINGATSTVAFKAIDQAGRGTDIEGYLKDNHDEVICNFRTLHDGMGSFNFFPKRNRTYTAFVKMKNDTVLKYVLPAIDPYAYQLAVTKRNKNGLVLRVAMGDSLYQKKQKTIIMGLSGEKLVFSAEGTDMYETYVPFRDFPEGIARFTLFNEKNQPVSERMIFVRKNTASVTIEADKENYAAREMINLAITTYDSINKVLSSGFSMSVTDNTVQPAAANEENILTNLLLQSDLRGYIDKPGFYFNETGMLADTALDLVMMTHGWSRYNWNNILFNNDPVKNDTLDVSLHINGKVKKRNDEPAQDYIVTLLHNNSGFLRIDTTGMNGEFSFSKIDYADKTQFILQVTDKKGANADVTVLLNDDQFPVINKTNEKKDIDYVKAMEENSSRYSALHTYDSTGGFKNAKVLKEVVIKNNRKRQVINYDVSKRLSFSSAILTSDRLQNFGSANLKTALLTIPGITIVNGRINMTGGVNSLFSDANSEPIVVIDGVVFSPDNILAGGIDGIFSGLDPNTIDFIEVLKGPEAAIYGVRGGNGVIAVNTKNDIATLGNGDRKGITVIRPKGYYNAKEFYTPAYDNASNRNNPVPDFRTTIYWKGRAVTNEEGKTNISFYSADMPADYLVTLEGITQNGNVLRKTMIIKRTK
ncbi:MAG: TonB-dependent receptor plug domain-containing protein [Bacteroidota bacterium]